MGFLKESTVFRFLKDKELDDTPPAPTLDPRAQRAEDVLFPRIEAGLRGEGLTPAITSQTQFRARNRQRREFTRQQQEFPSQLNRLVPREDVKVREFARRGLQRGRGLAEENLSRRFEGRGFQDRIISQGLALSSLATNEAIATRNAQQFNASQLRRSQSPTFASELAGGLGGATGTLAAGQTSFQDKGERFTGTSPSNFSNPEGIVESQDPGGGTGFFNLFSRSLRGTG